MQAKQHRSRHHRAPPHGRFAGLQGGGSSKDDTTELYVLGLPCTLFRDDDAASTIEAERHLVPWNGDYSTLVDRFDVRLLLEKLEDRQEAAGHRQLQTAAQEEEESSLDAERYADLDNSLEWQLGGTPGPQQPTGIDGAAWGSPQNSSGDDGSHGDDRSHSRSSSSAAQSGSESDTSADGDDASGDSSTDDDDAPLPPPPRPASAMPHAFDQSGEGTAHGSPFRVGYTAVGFKYEYGEPQQEEQQGGTEEASQGPVQHVQAEVVLPGPPYRPAFNLPSHLHVWPENTQLDKVIRETARFVRRGGGQVEVLLRVKQANNPTFGFLQPAHPLHPYYSWLVKEDPQEVLQPPPATATSTEGEAAADNSKELQANELARTGSWMAGIQYSDTEDSQPSSPAASNRSLSIEAQDALQYGPELPVGTQQQDGVHFGPQLPSASAQQDVDAKHVPMETSMQLPTAEQGKDASASASAVEDGVLQRSLAALPTSQSAAAEASLQSPLQARGSVSPEAGDRSLQSDMRAFESEKAASASQAPSTAAPQSGGATSGNEPADDTHSVMLVINRLVDFVKRSGAKFEATVRQREAKNPAFTFLQPTHPHNKLYREALAQALGSMVAADALLTESAAMVDSQAAARKQAASLPGRSPPVGAADSTSAGLVLTLAGSPATAAAAAAAAKPTALQAKTVYGPEKKPLVLKANPSALTGQQAMRLAAQQAAALISQQAAAAKAAGGAAASAAPTTAVAANDPAAVQQSLQQAVMQAARVMASKREAMLGAAAASAAPASAAPASAAAENQAAKQVVQQDVDQQDDGAVQSGSPEPAAVPPASATANVSVEAVQASEDMPGDAGEAAEETAEEREQKLLQRRMRARALLAQKMEERRRQEEEKQQQEAALRAQAVASHRQALLRAVADNDEHEIIMHTYQQQDATPLPPPRIAPFSSLSFSSAGMPKQAVGSKPDFSPSVTAAMHRLVMLQPAHDADLSLLDDLEELEEGELRLGQEPGTAVVEQPAEAASRLTVEQQVDAHLAQQDATAAAAGSSSAVVHTGEALLTEKEAVAACTSTTELKQGEPAAIAAGSTPATGSQAAVGTADILATSKTIPVQVEESSSPEVGDEQVADDKLTSAAQEGDGGAVAAAAVDTAAEHIAGAAAVDTTAEQLAAVTAVDTAAAAAEQGEQHSSTSSSSSSSSSREDSSSSSGSDSDVSEHPIRRSRRQHSNEPTHDKERPHSKEPPRSKERRHSKEQQSSKGRHHSKERHRSKEDKEERRSRARSPDRDQSHSKHAHRHHKRSRSERHKSPHRSHEPSRHHSSSHQREQHRSSSRGSKREADSRGDDSHRSRSERKRSRQDRSASPAAYDRKDTKRHKDRKEQGDSSVRTPGAAGAKLGTKASGPVVVVPVGDSIVLQPASVLDSKPPLPPSGPGDDLRQRLRSLMGQKFKL